MTIRENLAGVISGIGSRLTAHPDESLTATMLGSHGEVTRSLSYHDARHGERRTSPSSPRLALRHFRLFLGQMPHFPSLTRAANFAFVSRYRAMRR